jgi:predicted permease
MLSELRKAVRLLARSPKFVFVFASTLGLGIGLVTLVFTVINGVVLEPLRYPDPDRLVMLQTSFTDRPKPSSRITGGDWLDLQKASTLAGITQASAFTEVGVEAGGQAEFTHVAWVSTDYPRVFPIPVLRGRWFAPDESGRSAVVSRGFAERHFGSAAAALGQTVKTENRIFQITGVVEAAYPAEAQAWLYWADRPENLNRTAYNYVLVARLAPGATIETARAELRTIGARLAAEHSENRNKSFTVAPLRDHLVQRVRPLLWLLLGAVGLVLLISCANVANLLATRAAGRVGEYAVRTALGASRWTLVRQSLWESLTVGVAAAVAGLVLAEGGLHLMGQVASDLLPRWSEVSITGPVFAFAVAAGLVAALLAGLGPAWSASRVDLLLGLRQGTSKGQLRGVTGRFRTSLVVVQVALSVALAISAGLLFRSFLKLSSVDPGFRAESIVVMYSHIGAKTEAEYLEANRRFDLLSERLAAVPGVGAVTSAMGLPTGRYGSNGQFIVQGKHEFKSGVQLPGAGFRLTDPGYFATLGIPLLRGRDFARGDQFPSEPVAIVSESLVKNVFGAENPIGRKIKCGLDRDVWMTVVGVVGDVRSNSPAQPPQPELYMPLAQHPYHANERQVVVRALTTPGALIPALRQAVRDFDPLIPTRFVTLREMVDRSLDTERFRSRLFLLFACAALGVLLAGVYSVTAYAVETRLPELGLRAALGASAADLQRLILGNAFRLAVLGIGLGAVLAYGAGRLLQAWLFEVTVADPASYAAVAALVVGATLVAAWVPAYRAGRVDPQQALRGE